MLWHARGLTGTPSHLCISSWRHNINCILYSVSLCSGTIIEILIKLSLLGQVAPARNKVVSNYVWDPSFTWHSRNTIFLNNQGIYDYFHSIFNPEFVHSDLKAVFVHTMIFVKFVIARIKVVQQRFLQDCCVFLCSLQIYSM